MSQNANEKEKKEEGILECKLCKAIFVRKANLERHLNTRKHKMLLNATLFECECGKKYKHNSSYLRHLKKCNSQLLDTHNIKDVVLKIADNNEEIKNVVLEQQKVILEQQEQIKGLKQGDTNIYNNKFNLNVFLNEECKDALNLTEFIEQINICGKDLIYSGMNGTEEGLINIFTTNLQQLGTYKRPIHCSDAKRKTLYVKDNDGWEKDTEKEKFKKSLNDIYVKQIQQIKVWEQENPGWKDNPDKKDEYIKIVNSIMTNYDNSKVMNEVIRQTSIDK
tara:strand:+ start:659 stop:1492 length:834 start_codon:yes stop_codon:yes gene_type:complete